MELEAGVAGRGLVDDCDDVHRSLETENPDQVAGVFLVF